MDEKDILLLTRYLNDRCTKSELMKVAELLANPSSQDQLPGLLEEASKKFYGHFETSPAHQEKSWSKIRSELLVRRKITRQRKRSTRNGIRVAASIVLLMGVLFLLRVLVYDTPGSQAELKVQMKTVSNALGKKSRLTLPDGTVVIMNSGTTVTYPEKFAEEIRSVSLSGEAYFEVKESESHPFVVEVKGLKTKVLGTTFNIRANPYYDEVKVSLTSGKIAMQLPGDTLELVLEVGQEITYHPETNLYKVREFDREKVLGWKEGILYFNELSERQAIKTMEHWYDVNIEIVNSSSHKWENLSARYDNEPLENVLISLGYTLDFTYEINDKNIKIIYK